MKAKIPTRLNKPKLILAKGKMPIIKVLKRAGLLTPEMVKEMAQM